MKNNIVSITQTLDWMKDRVYEAQYVAFKAVNKELILLYWDLGKVIVEKQEIEGWGKSVVEEISKGLQNEFPGMKGLSSRNLWNMRNFYNSYQSNRKLQTLSAEIGWSQNVVIFERCKDEQQREFYMRMTIRQGWSVRTLEHMIENQEFEKWALEQTNFEDTTYNLAYKGEILLKDEYNLDFLAITKDAKERELENKIVTNIIPFLNEMGGNLMFVGRQHRLVIGEEEFFIDLLFYHKKLRAYVIVELKADKFQPEFAGKLAFYVNIIDRNLKDADHDNPSIGIILCKQKNRDIVDATLQIVTKPIGVSTYKTYGESSNLPGDIKKYLPTKEQIAGKLMKLLEE